MAVILSNMGIALFAYMDGQTHKSKTIGGVIFGALAAAFSAVFKVWQNGESKVKVEKVHT